ncbi:hypothetical protein IPL68_05880 [Candidatus Saccharibacteria bacterium]|nr:MAG: hypothetical protein IPL68_05880 [Candidatus Saccharibacteria bacterium]
MVVTTYDLRGDDATDAGIRVKEKEGGLYVPNLPVVPAFDSTHTDSVDVIGVATQDMARGRIIAANSIVSSDSE